MSMYSLLRSSEAPPTEEDIEDALGGNLWWVEHPSLVQNLVRAMAG